MTSSERPTEYLVRLLKIAKQNRVKVKILAETHAEGIDWDGLYLVTRELGAGIAIRRNLAPMWRDWVLAHELGHHFSQLNGTLFSPFRAHKTDSASRNRWDKARRLDPDEESANAWAVKTLVSDEAWDKAERGHALDLREIVAQLGLPFPAGVAWERCQRRQLNGAPITIALTEEVKDILNRPITGSGGHQSFFSRMKPKGNGVVTLSYADFSFARERAAVVGGGWLDRYRALLKAVAPIVESAGTTRSLFRLISHK